MTSANDQTFQSSRIMTINRRSRLTNLVHIQLCGTLKNPHTIQKEQGMQFPVLWSIFTYIITHHGLGEFSGFINGLIAASIGAFSMLTSEPTAKSNIQRTCMFVLSFSRHYFTMVTKVVKTLRYFVLNASSCIKNFLISPVSQFNVV